MRTLLQAARSAIVGTAGATVVVFALVTAAVAFAAVAMPRYDAAFRTHALDQRIAQAAPDATSMVLTSEESLRFGQQPDQLFNPVAGAMHDSLAQSLPMAPPNTDWYSVATSGQYIDQAPSKALSTAGSGSYVTLTYRSGLDQHARLVSGVLPGTPPRRTANSPEVSQVAVPLAVATRFGLRVGSSLHSSGSLGVVTLVVVGIVAPTDPAAAYWTEDPSLYEPTHVPQSGNVPAHWDAMVYVNAQGMRNLLGTRQDSPPVQVFLRWVLPLALAGIDADHIRPVVDHVAQVVAQRTVAQPDSANADIVPYLLSDAAVTSELPDYLGSWVAAQDSIVAALSLLLAGTATIGAALLLVAGRLVVTRRAAELAVLRARGQSVRQLALRVAAGAAVPALPAVAAGAVLGRLVTPGPATTLDRWAAEITAVVAVAGPAIVAVVLHRTASGGGDRTRERSAGNRYSRLRRYVAEGSLVTAAVAGLVVLREQGPMGGADAIDVFAAAAPALIAMPPAVLAPYGSVLATRAARRGMRRSRGAAVFVGLSQASRPRPGTATAIFVLVLTLGVVSFGPMLQDAVSHGGTTASWAAVGADAVVDVSNSGGTLSPTTRQGLIAASHASQSVTADVTQATFPQVLPTDRFTAGVVDPSAYAALLAGTAAPAPPPAFAVRSPTGVSVPVVTSPRLADELGDGDVTVSLPGAAPLTVRVVGTMPRSALAPGTADFVLVPAWAAGAQALSAKPNLLALRGAAIDGSALSSEAAKRAPGARVTLRSTALASLPGSSLQSGAYRMLDIGAGAAAAFSVLILLLTLALDAPARELALTRLRTLGLDGARIWAMAFAETLPTLLAAAVGGVVAAAAVAPIVGPRLDLSLFTGSPVPVPLQAGTAQVLLPALGMLAAAVATLLAQTALTRRRGLARALRTGEW
jgi:putative ABC transport system permease protein